MELSLDHWRVFVCVVDEGSFSAAARKLRRVQSAVSHAISTLELLTGTALFDRAGKIPGLTPAGRALVPEARRLVDDAAALAVRAARFAAGVEPRISLCVDAVFPIDGLVDVARAFAGLFPAVELVLFTETLNAVADAVRSGAADVGVCLPPADLKGLVAVRLGEVRMVPVVHKSHPLAAVRGPLTARQLDEHTQIVLSERSSSSASSSRAGTPDQGVLSGRTWRVVDLETKQALIAAGLGWGNLPEHRLRGARDLVVVDVAAWGRDRFRLDLSSVERRGVVSGPAARFLKSALAERCQPVGQSSSAKSPAQPRAASADDGGSSRSASRTRGRKRNAASS